MRAVAAKLPVQRLSGALRENWQTLAVVLGIAALWLLAGLAGAGASAPGLPPQYEATDTAAAAELRRVAATRAAPDQLKQIAPTDAVAVNAGIPISVLPNPAATPFALNAASAADRARSIDCLAAAIYYEAATEPLDGQRAVAQVVLNRVRHPAWPSTVCGVVFEGSQRATGCQFTFSCDGALRRSPSAAGWARARMVAEAALSGYVYKPVGWATHYHTNWVVPYWASSLVKAANVGTHIFYRWTGGWGRGGAFRVRHAGAEPAIAWRGGFGRPAAEEDELLVGTAAERDAAARQAAADAAVEAATGHSVDSFQRAVLRRYEPLSRETATKQIEERATRAGSTLTQSQRWALTGEPSGGEGAPLGRSAEAAAPAEAAPQPVR